MREIQIVLIPKDKKYSSRNMTITNAMEFFKVSKEELYRYIENGEELKGWFVDEAMIYDSKL